MNAFMRPPLGSGPVARAAPKSTPIKRPLATAALLRSTSRRVTRRLDSFQSGFSRMLYPIANPHIRPTATDVAGHCGVDIRIIRRGISSQQRRCRHDLSRLAVAALDDFEIEPRLLDFGSRSGLAHTFD